MDPKRADELLRQIKLVQEEHENRQQLIALGHYAKLLKTCGVRKIIVRPVAV
jgi:hypothetical protein